MGSYQLGKLDEAMRLIGAARTVLCNWCRQHGISAIGVIDPKLGDNGHYWSLHIHLMLGPCPDDLSAMRALWRGVVGERGNVVPTPMETYARAAGDGAPADKDERFASYMAKQKDVCPRPDTMDLDDLQELWQAVKGKQMGIAWGVARSRPAASRVATDARRPADV
jgi:hypothetical protein